MRSSATVLLLVFGITAALASNLGTDPRNDEGRLVLEVDAGDGCNGGDYNDRSDYDYCSYSWVCSDDNTYKVRCNVNPDPNTCTCYLNENEVGTFEDNGICGEVTVAYRTRLAATECGWDLGDQ